MDVQGARRKENESTKHRFLSSEVNKHWREDVGLCLKVKLLPNTCGLRNFTLLSRYTQTNYLHAFSVCDIL